MFKKTSKKISLTLILVLSLLIICCPLIKVEADAPPPGEIENPLEAESFTELFVGIANWLAGIVGLVAVLMVIIGGFQYMVSGGNEEKVKKARQTIQWSLIGLGIALGSWGLLNALLEILGVE